SGPVSAAERMLKSGAGREGASRSTLQVAQGHEVRSNCQESRSLRPSFQVMTSACPSFLRAVGIQFGDMGEMIVVKSSVSGGSGDFSQVQLSKIAENPTMEQVREKRPEKNRLLASHRRG